MLGRPRRERRSVARATFSSKWVAAIRRTIGEQSKSTINWLPKRRSRSTGATRRFSKKASAWKRKPTGRARSRHFTQSWKMTRAPIGLSFSGITRRDSMQHGSWRMIQNGNPLQLFIKGWPPPTAAGVKKHGRASIVCAWNIFSGGVILGLGEVPVSGVQHCRKCRFFVPNGPPAGILLCCTTQKKGAHFVHDNCNSVYPPVRCRTRARILHVGICRSEQKRSPSGNTADGREDREKNVLRKPLKLPYSDALHSACRDSDHRQPDGYSRDRVKIIDNNSGKISSPEMARRLARQRCLLLFVCAFPTHQSAQPPPHFFDRMFFGFPQQPCVTLSAGFHFLNKFARKFSRANFPQRFGHPSFDCLIDDL